MEVYDMLNQSYFTNESIALSSRLYDEYIMVLEKKCIAEIYACLRLDLNNQSVELFPFF